MDRAEDVAVDSELARIGSLKGWEDVSLLTYDFCSSYSVVLDRESMSLRVIVDDGDTNEVAPVHGHLGPRTRVEATIVESVRASNNCEIASDRNNARTGRARYQ